MTPIAATRAALGILCLVTASGCSTYVEQISSADFAPVFPQDAAADRLATGSIYHHGAPGLFVSDRRASQVGDVLTIALNESFQASKSQTTSAAKSDSFSTALPAAIFGGFDGASMSTSSASNFNGEGSAAQSNSFTGLVTVSVVRVFPNDNLEILGQKKLTLNNGDEYIRVRGIVRPADIGAGNIVNSNRLANAEITYIGAGDLADSGKRGWLSRIISNVAPL